MGCPKLSEECYADINRRSRLRFFYPEDAADYVKGRARLAEAAVFYAEENDFKAGKMANNEDLSFAKKREMGADPAPTRRYYSNSKSVPPREDKDK